MSGGGGSSSSAIAAVTTPTRITGNVRRASELDGATPDQRPAQALRRAITLDFGDVNTNGDAGLGAADRMGDGLPAGATVLKSYKYKGSKEHMGANWILLTKTNQKKLVCAAWYTTPEVLGMDIVDNLKTKHENDGKDGSFSKRLPGFTWVGFDPSGITKGEKAIRKAAWICTPVSASSTSQVMTNVQDLGKDLLTGNFPMDLHIAELLISDDAAKKLNVKLSILQRTIKLDTTVESNPFGDDSAVA
jgi:hypothetical protein